MHTAFVALHSWPSAIPSSALPLHSSAGAGDGGVGGVAGVPGVGGLARFGDEGRGEGPHSRASTRAHSSSTASPNAPKTAAASLASPRVAAACSSALVSARTASSMAAATRRASVAAARGCGERGVGRVSGCGVSGGWVTGFSVAGGVSGLAGESSITN